MPRLFWIKVWTEEWLDGSIREQLTPVERSIWIDLLVMAGRSRTPGIVQSNPSKAYTHAYLAGRFKIALNVLETALKHLKEQQRITENEVGITIINWDVYQGGKAKEQKHYPMSNANKE